VSARNAADSPDKISISGPSSALNRLAGERASRVQQLSLSIKNGTYNVSSQTIGAAIVASGISS